MLKLLLKILIIGIPVTGLSYFYSENIYMYLIQEDGIYENLTAIGMLVGAILVFAKIFRSSNLTKYQKGFYIFLALMMFFGFGEEISWGQRIFDIETTGYLAENNLQGETNLHNLKINGVKVNKVIFSLGLGVVIFVYFFVMYFLYTKNTWVKNTIDRFGIHVPKLQHSGLFLVAIAIVMTIPHGKKWELIEVVFVLLFLLVMLDPYNKKYAVLS